MKTHTLKSMPFALPRDDGGAIKFQFVTQLGKTFEFQCSPEAVPQILTGMMSALEQAAKIKIPEKSLRAVHTHHHEVGISLEQDAVILTLFASEHAGVSFSLAPEMADRLSSGLAASTAMLRPVDNPKSLS